ncbi:hypothetical protein G7Z17_g10240 [Cylindrodendrum hubeiense]|uniref:G domain-containing protein n=1 Tax=Cylindrodendrum hubeiense TaxID=595255 RepID=A0A9P5GY10_9HYPO|nr:hypothetical protein G7Z17_g10240 [Cylindrodendrum hubeiense]
MDAMDLVPEQLADQAQRFGAFIGATKPSLEDRFFLVMGTKSVEVFDFMCHGRRIYLIDTPGFDDTIRSNIDTLEILATYLGASYANGVRIHGLIMLHSIANNRMTWSSLRSIEMMKAMCGFKFYDNLAIAMTMWPETPGPADTATAEGRYAELLSNKNFFGELVAQRASVFRHNEKGHRESFEETASAQRIVTHLIHQSEIHAPAVLQLQRDIIDHRKTLGETAAGIVIVGDLNKDHQDHKCQLQELETRMRARLSQVDSVNTNQQQDLHDLQELKSEVEKKVKKFEQDKMVLNKSIQDMHKEEMRIWEEKIKELDTQFSYQLAAKEQDLRDMEASLREMRKDMDIRLRNSNQKKITTQAEVEDTKHEEIINTAREAVIKARGAYQKFRGQVGNILNGTANGLAAGLTSGAIAARKLALHP